MQGVDVADLGVARIFPPDPRGIGLGGSQLLPHLRGRLQNADRVAETLRHLGLAVEPEDPLRLGEERLRLAKELFPPSELGIPLPADLPGQFEMLDLVLADRHQVRSVKQDVGRHEDGVIEEPGRHALEASRLIFELRHSLEFADRGDRVEEPLQFGMLRDMRLDEENRAIGIDAGREETHRHFPRPPRQRRGLVFPGDGVKIHHREKALVGLLEPDPVLDRSEPVADMQFAGGLDSREDACHWGKLPDEDGPRKMPSPNDLLAIATTAAHAAGAYLRGAARPRDPAGWTAKGRADWATEVDRTSETLITRILTEAVPNSHVVGEELSPDLVTRGVVWVVDPLDGTTNFLHGFPAFAVSIAAAVDGVLEAAAVLHVPLDRMTTATRGGGAFENGARISVSTIGDPGHALVGTGFPFRDFAHLELYLTQLSRVLLGSTGVRRPGSAAIDLADVAAGRLEGFWEQRLSAWDIAAGILLVREAGGLVTDFSARDLQVEHAEVLAGNPPIHRWLLEVLNHRE